MIARPITALQSRIEAVGSGDFSADPAIEWDNELGDIGRGINKMSGNITALMDRRLEDEKQKQDLEYRMLQNQINPHFIYNTLNSIKWMATIQHAPGIAQMVTALSRLLKIVVTDNGKGLPPDMTGAYAHTDRELSRGHLGLYNVDTILRKYYGEDFGLYLSSGSQGRGAVITATLPLRREEEPEC